ncbi:MAG: GYD domain-containing protein [Chloroflexi bacterium]|nr:GYD domain-containing protein [Chloroflexota bacterium]
MPTYVVLYKFTDQGLKSIKDTVKRAREVRAENERRGFKVIGTYWTQGQYDLVSIVDAPSEDAMLAGLFNIAATGNVHSQTLRAYTDAEMEKALQAG